MTLGASWFESFTLPEQVKWTLIDPLARKNPSSATEFANASLDYMTDGSFDALEIGDELNLYPNASHLLKYNISDFVHQWTHYANALSGNLSLPAGPNF